MSRWAPYLRIAFSVACGIACVLLVMLWMRSYYSQDCLRGYFPDGSPIGNTWQLAAREGKFAGTICRARGIKKWRLISGESPDWLYAELGFEISEPQQPAWPRGFAFTCPYWVPLLVVSVAASLPWLPWRFSLRTLLMATTLIAVVLGAIAYAARN